MSGAATGAPARDATSRPPARLIRVATLNRGKAREIAALLAGVPARVEPLAPVPAVRFPEEGGDYERNALGKARAVARQQGVIAVADDSGLEVDFLDGAPGPYSARYGGAELDDAARVRHLLQALEGVSGAARAARFVCWAAVATPGGEAFVAHGECAGILRERPEGDGGFGYDPIFQPEGHEVTMAMLDARAKDALSHRGRAFRALLPDLLRCLQAAS